MISHCRHVVIFWWGKLHGKKELFMKRCGMKEGRMRKEFELKMRRRRGKGFIFIVRDKRFWDVKGHLFNMECKVSPGRSGLLGQPQRLISSCWHLENLDTLPAPHSLCTKEAPLNAP
jgi:hypothetical protein